MAEISQTMTDSGEGSGYRIQIGKIDGDVTFGKADKPKPQDVGFFPFPVDQYAPPRYPSLRPMKEFFDRVKNHHLLVIGGSNELDKTEIARHLAWYVRQELPLDSTDPESEKDEKDTDAEVNGKKKKQKKSLHRQVYEWQRSEKALGLHTIIRTTPDSTIFILPQLEPKDVGFDLTALQKAAVGGRHYVIISVIKPLNSWKLGSEAQTSIWYDLKDDNLWDPEPLARALIAVLDENRHYFSTEFLPEIMEPNQQFVGPLTYSEVAKQLRTPTNIITFVNLLRAENQPDQEHIICQLIESAKGGEQMLKQWFHTQLTPQERLLAVSICLLDGLYDNQFFAVLERLLDSLWRQRLPLMGFFDYGDLDNLSNLIKPVDVTRGVPTEPYPTLEETDPASLYQAKVEVRSPDLRRKLLKIAWSSHRRWILATLPGLVELVQRSALFTHPAELFGSQPKRMLFREVISDILTELGLISLPAIEDTLIQLAADEQIAVQAVAARAMAQWRDFGLDDALFETLQSWQYNTRVIAFIDFLLNEKDRQNRAKPLAYIRATVALTVSYAAQYDHPGHLSDKLCDLLNDLADDSTPLVRNRFCNHTLLWVVPWHLEKLRDFLHDLPLKNTEAFYEPIAIALASTYEVAPYQVLETVDMWLKEGRDKRPKEVPDNVTQREALMAAAILTYGYIWYDQRIGPLTIRWTFVKMRQILEEEEHPLVRGAVIATIALQARQAFGQVEALLPDLIKEMKPSERATLVDEMTKIYLEQRRELKGGEKTIKIKGQDYPVWLDSSRPLTEIEHQMEGWVQKMERPVAQEMGLQASVGFVKEFDQLEKEELDKIRKQDKEKKEEPEKNQHKKRAATGSFLGQLRLWVHSRMAWLTTIGAKQYYPIIISLLPDVLSQNTIDKTALQFLLDKWTDLSEGDIKIIAQRIKWTFTLTGCMVRMGLLLGVVAIVGLIMVLSR